MLFEIQLDPFILVTDVEDECTQEVFGEELVEKNMDDRIVKLLVDDSFANVPGPIDSSWKQNFAETNDSLGFHPHSKSVAKNGSNLERSELTGQTLHFLNDLSKEAGVEVVSDGWQAIDARIIVIRRSLDDWSVFKNSIINMLMEILVFWNFNSTLASI